MCRPERNSIDGESANGLAHGVILEQQDNPLEARGAHGSTNYKTRTVRPYLSV